MTGQTVNAMEPMLHYAPTDWLEDGTPMSRDFGDVYFSRSRGREETDYVFLQGCGLPEGWEGKRSFTIGELGFGTGLNVLHTWQRFEQTAPADAMLHVVSVEGFPLSPADMQRALAGWNGPEAAALLAQYPLPVPGWHRLRVGRMILTLGFGDAEVLLADYDASIDAWYLDGFSPAKNERMWSDGVFDAVARMSHAGTRIASFTAAGSVRRALSERGFAIERRDGFGHKRHAIHGVFQTPSSSVVRHAPADATIIGAGIAGATLAHALASRGVKVTVMERAQDAAQAASGNPLAVLYPHITQQWGANMAWHLAGFAQAVRMLHAAPYAARTGMLKTPKDAKDEQRLRHACEQFEPDLVRWVEPDEAVTLIGTVPPVGGAWFAHSGWVRPHAWCKDALSHANITLRYGCHVEAITQQTGGWSINIDDRIEHASTLILTNADDAARLYAPLAGMMFQSAGQISMVPASDRGTPLSAVLCHRGYMIPDGEHLLVGATYDHEDLRCDVTASNHAKNAQEAVRALPASIRLDAQYTTWQGRTSLRASTRDRLPLVGEVEEGLYMSAGHGSRGMVSAPYAAEIIASMLCGEPLPIGRSLRASVHPLRRLRHGE